LTRECERDAKSAQCARSKELQQFALCLEDVNSAECRYEANLLRLQGLGLPVGWNTDVENRWPGWRLHGSEFWSEWSKLTRIHGLGWLLTALAISLGAPLWFDLLNKFMVVRSVIKPREVPDED
jgi:hypothetical protein